MNCGGDILDRSTAFTGMQASLDDVCSKLKVHQDGVKPCPPPRDVLPSVGQIGHYTVDHYDDQTIKLRCLTYFRLRSGDLVLQCLPNGVWNGTEPKCVLMRGMSKWAIMTVILLTCVSIAAVALTTDFILWRIRKRKQRAEAKFRKMVKKIGDRYTDCDIFADELTDVRGSGVDPIVCRKVRAGHKNSALKLVRWSLPSEIDSRPSQAKPYSRRPYGTSTNLDEFMLPRLKRDAPTGKQEDPRQYPGPSKGAYGEKRESTETSISTISSSTPPSMKGSNPDIRTMFKSRERGSTQSEAGGSQH